MTFHREGAICCWFIFQSLFQVIQFQSKPVAVNATLDCHARCFRLGHAWLIDFDLAAKEGTPYPATYNSYLDERHPSASPRQPRKKEHDCYSLGVILEENGVRSEIVDQVKAGKDKLSEIADQLKAQV